MTFTRKKMIIVTAVVVVLLVVGVIGYLFLTGRFTAPATTESTPDIAQTGDAYKEYFSKSQAEVNSLVTAGGEQSIQQAEKIVEKEIIKAEESKNENYTIDAYLEKASLLINTGRAQEALDDVLFPLLETYGSNDEHKFNIYGMISLAYRMLDNQAKADEYFNQLPAKGWD